MLSVEIVVLAAALCLGLVALLQILLVLGAPLGRWAWGGKSSGRLSGRLRGASAFAALVCAAAAWVLLVRAGSIDGPADTTLVRVGARAFAIVFALSALGNLASSSRAERWIMTPVAALLAFAFYLASRS